MSGVISFFLDILFSVFGKFFLGFLSLVDFIYDNTIGLLKASIKEHAHLPVFLFAASAILLITCLSLKIRKTKNRKNNAPREPKQSN